MTGDPITLAGGSADALVAAAYLARRERCVTLVDRHGSGSRSLATDSFLTPYSFDLGLGFLLRAGAGDVIDEFAEGLALLEPAVPIAVERPGSEPFCLYRDCGDTFAQLDAPRERQRAQQLVADGRVIRRALLDAAASGDVDSVVGRGARLTVRELLDAYDLRDEDLRCALTYLPLAFGFDIESPGTGLAVPLLLAGLERFTTVNRGMGLLAATLTDDITRHGGELLPDGPGQASADGNRAKLDGAPVMASPRGALDESLGLARAFVGGRSQAASSPSGYLTVLDCPGEDAIYTHLSALRRGEERAPVGHVLMRTAPDPRSEGHVLVSAIWQGPCPAGESMTAQLGARAAVACRRVAGLERSDFELFWPPQETGSSLELPDWPSLINRRADHSGSPGVAAASGLMTGRALARTLAPEAGRDGGFR